MRPPVEADLVTAEDTEFETRIPNGSAARLELTVRGLLLGESLCVGSLEALFKAMHGTKSVLARIEILRRRRDRGGVFGVVACCQVNDDEVPGMATCATGGGV